MITSALVRRINSLLSEKGIQKQIFFQDCGITSSAYSQWATEKTSPRLKKLQEIAKYLDTTPEYLLGGSGQKEPPAQEGERSESAPDENFVILSRNAKKLSPEKRKQLLDMARVMFKEEFDD